MNEATLQDRRILVVEDEYFIADAMRRSLRKLGAVVLGPVPSVSEALALLDAEPTVDGAILDVNLAGEQVFPVADALTRRGTRFVFATGYGSGDMPPAYRNAPRCDKPINLDQAARALGEQFA